MRVTYNEVHKSVVVGANIKCVFMFVFAHHTAGVSFHLFDMAFDVSARACVCVYLCAFRSEEGGEHLSHAEAPPHCRAAGDVQLGRDALHGVRVVSSPQLRSARIHAQVVSPTPPSRRTELHSPVGTSATPPPPVRE